MTVSKTLSILLLATSLGFVGCKKKEDASSAAPGSAATSSAAATKPAEPAAAAPAPAAPAVPATPPPAAATPAGAITSDDQYIATVTAGLDKVITLFKGAGTNCDKLADDLVKFAQDNGPQIKAYREYEKAHPEAQAKFNAAAQSKVTDFQASAGPAIDACKDNKKLADAMAKLGSE